MDPIYAAIQHLNNRNSDGARVENGVGFNKVDTVFGSMAARTPLTDWNIELRWTAYKMLYKYREQLLQAGIVYADIPVPQKPDKDDATARMIARQQAKFATVTKVVRYTTRGLLVSWGGYNAAMLAAFKETFPASNERSWDADNTKDWFVYLLSLDTIERLFSFCAAKQIVITDEALSFIQLKIEEFQRNPAAQREPVKTPPKIKIGRFIEAIDPLNMRVAFDYEKELVDELKALEIGVWHPGDAPLDRYWTVNIAEEATVDKLIEYGEAFGFEWRNGVLDRIKGARAFAAQAYNESHKAETDFRFDGLLREPYGFQWAGAEFGTKHKRTIIGDSPGLGKTIQSIMIAYFLKAFPVLCVVPKTVDINWLREWTMTVDGLKVNVFSKNTDWLHCDVFVINYDMLPRKVKKGATETWKDVLLQRQWETIICDEAHLLKSSKALRTKAVKDLAKNCSVKLMLTGTPILNRPVELVTLLDIIDRLKSDFGGWKAFTKRYCSSRPIYVKGKLVQQNAGAHNLAELHNKLRSTGSMIRRLKENVLKDLPAKTYTVVPVELDNREEYERAEEDVISFIADIAARDKEFLESIAHLDDEDQATLKKKRAQEAAVKAERAQVLVRINTLRQITARGKMQAVKEWIEEFHENSEKLVFFGWHREIVEELATHFHADSITGGTANRQEIVDRFQNDSDVMDIFLNIIAGGVGITLTASSNVGFVELPWSPSMVDQCVDRTHRIGQPNAVTAWFLLAPETIDMDMYNMIATKRSVINQTMDGSSEEQEMSALSDVMNSLLNRQKLQQRQLL